MRRTVLLSLGLIVLLSLLNGLGDAAAQSPDITTLLSGRGSSAAAPSNQSTARSTMTKFLDAMNDVRAGQTQRLDEALACLYLGELTQEERAAQSESIASRLFEIIDHEGVQLDAFPDAEEGADYTAITTSAGPITLHRYEDGLWRFNSRTVARAVEMHNAVVGDAAGAGGGLGSPREALRTFVEGMERGDEAGREEAVSALELPEDKSAEETAFILYQVLIRFPKVVYQEISTPAGDLPYVYPLAGSDYQLVIAPVTPDGQWKFTAESLTGLWDL